MRDILFRGKRVDNGEWIYGGIIPLDENCVCIVPPYQSASTLTVRNLVAGLCEMVIPETVGQYTGLTDKNGTKIFEGDIVKYGDTVHLIVFEQRNGTAYFGLVYSGIETLPFGHYQDSRRIEVIGNKFDNPELLGGVK